MKDIRLPEGFNSWTQLAKNVMSQDEININDNKQKFYQDYKSDDRSGIERFECDVLTLKLRAFDELKDIIPDAEELQQAKHEIFYMMLQGGNPHGLQGNKAIKLIDSILKLVSGERYVAKPMLNDFMMTKKDIKKLVNAIFDNHSNNPKNPHPSIQELMQEAVESALKKIEAQESEESPE